MTVCNTRIYQTSFYQNTHKPLTYSKFLTKLHERDFIISILFSTAFSPHTAQVPKKQALKQPFTSTNNVGYKGISDTLFFSDTLLFILCI